MQKVLCLGAAPFQVPLIKKAKEKGYYLISVDNISDNPGHRLADKSYSISLQDKKALLELAKQEAVDGVLAFASDLAARAAAFITTQLALAGQSEETTQLLTNKYAFRRHFFEGIFHEQSFSCPQKAASYLRKSRRTLIVKPIDSSGSKGVSIFQPLDDPDAAIEKAFSFSSEIIIEDYFEKEDKQLCGDGFFQKGKIVFIAFGDGHFPQSSHPEPFAETFPSEHSEESLALAKTALEALLRKAKFAEGAFNFDIIITKEARPLILECAPRAGGNFLASLISLHTGVDFLGAIVDQALGKRPRFPAKLLSKACAGYMLFAQKKQVYRGVALSDLAKSYQFLRTDYKKEGALLIPLSKDKTAANMIFNFPSEILMRDFFSQIDKECFLR